MKKYFCGNEMDKMPNIAFRIMSIMFKLKDIFAPIDNRIKAFGIKKNFVVIDYGCGPGRYLEKASQLVGKKGKVYAIDIHKLAIEAVENKIKKYGFKNVLPVLANGYSCSLYD